MNEYCIESNIIIPFRALIEPLEIKLKIPNERQETSFKLYYEEQIDLGDVSHKYNTRSYSLVRIKKLQKFDGSVREAIEWGKREHQRIVSENIIPSINYFFTLIKYNQPSVFYTGTMRSIGMIDLVYYNLLVEHDAVFARGTSNFFSSFGGVEKQTLTDDTVIKDDPPKEWTILTRSVDLINHGYVLEGFVIAFALLDDLTQEFFKNNIPNLGRDKSEDFLRRIETQRLRTYFGPLSCIVIGKSILDEQFQAERLSWLNDKRNKIMHRGEEINFKEARKGLEIICDFITFLNENGAGYILPDKLEFW